VDTARGCNRDVIAARYDPAAISQSPVVRPPDALLCRVVERLIWQRAGEFDERPNDLAPLRFLGRTIREFHPLQDIALSEYQLNTDRGVCMRSRHDGHERFVVRAGATDGR